MSKNNQLDRYRKKEKTNNITIKKTNSIHLKNWQKITILIILGIACIGAIITIVYLTVIK